MQLRDGLAHGLCQVALVVILEQMRHGLRIRLARKLMALLLEGLAQGGEVLDDTVVDDGDLSRAVAMRMGVYLTGLAMSGPARMPDAAGSGQVHIGDGIGELLHLAHAADHLEA